MTSHDVRDMLDLPDASSRPAKKQKLAAPRPVLKGLAREVQNLSGDNPIAIVPEVSVFKKRRFANRKPAAKWELKPFTNSARDGDLLVLRHWRRKTEPPAVHVGEDGNGEAEEAPKPEAPIEDSTFAKFNVRVNVPEYTEEEYNSKLQNQDWSKDETDYLLHLACEYDLRWAVIWDQYEYQPPLPVEGTNAMEGVIVVPPKIRSMEDMKARYYSVAATMMAERKPPIKMNSAEFGLHELMSNFNPATEIARKKFAEAAFQRTKEEAREEESLLLELKRIMARSDKLSEERKELYARLEAPPSSGNIGLYTSSQGLQSLLQQLMQVSKKRKSLMGAEGASPAAGPGLNQQASFDRRDSHVRGESISGPSASNNKKGPQQGPSERRQLTEDEERIYGVSRHERIGTSGPAFRHEKINKPLVSKSVTQQAKISNVLLELEVPPRLTMPTIEVGEAYDSLLSSIITLVDARKVIDKLDGEIKFAKAQKEEREKHARVERGEPLEGDHEVKVEEREKSVARSVRAGSTSRSVRGESAPHKRSASVLSTTSDKSTKKQKR